MDGNSLRSSSSLVRADSSLEVRRLWFILLRFKRPSGRRQLPNSLRIRIPSDGLHIRRRFFPISTSPWSCSSSTDATPTFDDFLRLDCCQSTPPVARLRYRGRTTVGRRSCSFRWSDPSRTRIHPSNPHQNLRVIQAKLPHRRRYYTEVRLRQPRPSGARIRRSSVQLHRRSSRCRNRGTRSSPKSIRREV